VQQDLRPYVFQQVLEVSSYEWVIINASPALNAIADWEIDDDVSGELDKFSEELEPLVSRRGKGVGTPRVSSVVLCCVVCRQ
jgi:hypothetical protein